MVGGQPMGKFTNYDLGFAQRKWVRFAVAWQIWNLAF
jgi:hypothetical protein